MTAHTSIAAYEATREIAKEMSRVVLDLLTANPDGLTCDEMAERTGELILSVRPTCTQLRQGGKIKDSGRTRINQNKKYSIVWVLGCEPDLDPDAASHTIKVEIRAGEVQSCEGIEVIAEEALRKAGLTIKTVKCKEKLKFKEILD